MSVELTHQTFESTVQDNSMVIVDFWAPWCGPCRAFAPVFEKVSKEEPGVVFAKVNTEDQPELAAAFKIRSIPTLMIFKDQHIVFAQPGALPEEALKDIVQQLKVLDMEKVKAEMEKNK